MFGTSYNWQEALIIHVDLFKKKRCLVSVKPVTSCSLPVLRWLCMRWFPQRRGKVEGHWAVAGIELNMQCCATESHLKMWIWTGKLEVPTVSSVHFSSCRTGHIEYWKDERRQSQTHQQEHVKMLQSQITWKTRIIKLHDERICKDTEVNREYPPTNLSLLKFSLKNAFPKWKIGESVEIMVR